MHGRLLHYDYLQEGYTRGLGNKKVATRVAIWSPLSIYTYGGCAHEIVLQED